MIQRLQIGNLYIDTNTYDNTHQPLPRLNPRKRKVFPMSGTRAVVRNSN